MSLQDIREVAVKYGYNDEELLSDFLARMLENATHVDNINKLCIRLVMAMGRGQVAAVESGRERVSCLLSTDSALPDHSHITLQTGTDEFGNTWVGASIVQKTELHVVPEVAVAQ